MTDETQTPDAKEAKEAEALAEATEAKEAQEKADAAARVAAGPNAVPTVQVKKGGTVITINKSALDTYKDEGWKKA